MVKSDCNVCKKGVITKLGGIACEKCLMWFHVACVFGVLEVSMDLLSHKNIVFLCDECVEDEGKEKADCGS